MPPDNDPVLAAALRASRARQDVLAGAVYEARRNVQAIDTGVGLKRYPAVIVMGVDIDAAGDSGGEDTFTIPDVYDLVLYEIAGSMALLDADSASETLSIGNLGNVQVFDRLALKALNCLISLDINSNDVAWSKHKDIPLADIYPLVGGKPLYFDKDGLPGAVVPHGSKIRVVATLNDTAAALIGGSTRYGVTLRGEFYTRPNNPLRDR